MMREGLSQGSGEHLGRGVDVKKSKPAMEKRRRARINASLAELRSLIPESVRRNNRRYSKMEKADILEMAVQYLRHLQHVNKDKGQVKKTSYSLGFSECTQEVSEFLRSTSPFTTRLKGNLLEHLNGCAPYKQPDSPSSSPAKTGSVRRRSNKAVLTPSSIIAQCLLSSTGLATPRVSSGPDRHVVTPAAVSSTSDVIGADVTLGSLHAGDSDVREDSPAGVASRDLGTDPRIQHPDAVSVRRDLMSSFGNGTNCSCSLKLHSNTTTTSTNNNNNNNSNNEYGTNSRSNCRLILESNSYHENGTQLTNENTTAENVNAGAERADRPSPRGPSIESDNHINGNKNRNNNNNVNVDISGSEGNMSTERMTGVQSPCRSPTLDLHDLPMPNSRSLTMQQKNLHSNDETLASRDETRLLATNSSRIECNIDNINNANDVCINTCARELKSGMISLSHTNNSPPMNGDATTTEQNVRLCPADPHSHVSKAAGAKQENNDSGSQSSKQVISIQADSSVGDSALHLSNVSLNREEALVSPANVQKMASFLIPIYVQTSFGDGDNPSFQQAFVINTPKNNVTANSLKSLTPGEETIGVSNTTAISSPNETKQSEITLSQQNVQKSVVTSLSSQPIMSTFCPLPALSNMTTSDIKSYVEIDRATAINQTLSDMSLYSFTDPVTKQERGIPDVTSNAKLDLSNNPVEEFDTSPEKNARTIQTGKSPILEQKIIFGAPSISSEGFSLENVTDIKQTNSTQKPDGVQTGGQKRKLPCELLTTRFRPIAPKTKSSDNLETRGLVKESHYPVMSQVSAALDVPQCSRPTPVYSYNDQYSHQSTDEYKESGINKCPTISGNAVQVRRPFRESKHESIYSVPENFLSRGEDILTTALKSKGPLDRSGLMARRRCVQGITPARFISSAVSESLGNPPHIVRMVQETRDEMPGPNCTRHCLIHHGDFSSIPVPKAYQTHRCQNLEHGHDNLILDCSNRCHSSGNPHVGDMTLTPGATSLDEDFMEDEEDNVGSATSCLPSAPIIPSKCSRFFTSLTNDHTELDRVETKLQNTQSSVDLEKFIGCKKTVRSKASERSTNVTAWATRQSSGKVWTPFHLLGQSDTPNQLSHTFTSPQSLQIKNFEKLMEPCSPQPLNLSKHCDKQTSSESETDFVEERYLSCAVSKRSRYDVFACSEQIEPNHFRTCPVKISNKLYLTPSTLNMRLSRTSAETGPNFRNDQFSQDMFQNMMICDDDQTLPSEMFDSSIDESVRKDTYISRLDQHDKTSLGEPKNSRGDFSQSASGLISHKCAETTTWQPGTTRRCHEPGHNVGSAKSFALNLNQPGYTTKLNFCEVSQKNVQTSDAETSPAFISYGPDGYFRFSETSMSSEGSALTVSTRGLPHPLAEGDEEDVWRPW